MKPTHHSIWAIFPPALEAIESRLETLTLSAGSWWDEYCAEIADERFSARFDAKSGVLALPIIGVLMRGANAEQEAFWGMYDTRRIETALAFAAQDQRVKTVALLWDSPGGYCAGMNATLTAMDALKAARPQVAVRSLANGLCCSMAYVFAAAGQKLDVMKGSMIGSIGVMATTTDYSKMFEKAGVERRLFASGKFKGMGTIGIAWTDDWYKAVQSRVDTLFAQVTTIIKANRSGVKDEDMQGQAWDADEAPSALYDAIFSGSVEDWIETL